MKKWWRHTETFPTMYQCLSNRGGRNDQTNNSTVYSVVGGWKYLLTDQLDSIC